MVWYTLHDSILRYAITLLDRIFGIIFQNIRISSVEQKRVTGKFPMPITFNPTRVVCLLNLPPLLSLLNHFGSQKYYYYDRIWGITDFGK